MKKKVIILTVALVISVPCFGWGAWNYFTNEVGKAPVLEVENEVLSVSVKADTSELLQDVHATDSEDGNLDSNIYVDSISDFSESNVAKIHYIVFDSNNNSAQLTRTIQYTDYTEPTFYLKKRFVIPVSQTSIDFSEYIGATDALDGDISGNITLVDSNINTYALGQYNATFEVKNSRHETQQITLPVLVNNVDEHPFFIELNSYITYVGVNSEIDLASYITQVSDSNENAVPYTFDEYEFRTQGINENNVFVTVEPNVDLSTPGTYYVTYNVIDRNEIITTTMLTVVVR